MEKKKFKMPHTFVIIGIIILFAVALTWIIPAGSYVRFENEAGIKVIDPTQFSYIDRTPVNPLEIPLYIVKAFVKRIDLMLVILFAGGAFHLLTKTGALHAVIAKMAKEEDPYNFILMQAAGANVAGQVASVIAGGLILTLMMG